MGLALSQREASQFPRYFDLYNILWVATATPEATDFIRRVAEPVTGGAGGPAGPTVKVIWQSRRYTLWRVNREPGFTDVAGLEVTAGIDRIEIEATGELPPFVLKYHWDAGLSVTPPATISSELRLDDPVPFIRVLPNGADRVVINY